MTITNVAALRKNLYGTAENAVILSESEHDSMMETLYPMSAPRVYDESMKAKKADPSDYEGYDPNEER